MAHSFEAAAVMMDLPLKLKASPEFTRWIASLSPGLRRRVDARLDLLRIGTFVNSRSLGAGLFELKWPIGMRVYFSRKRVGAVDVILLLGGFKGTQNSDISRARRLKDKYEEELEEDGR